MDNLKDILVDLTYSFPIFPILWIPHCIMMAVHLRTSYNHDLNMAKRNPFGVFISGMLYTYTGGMLSSILIAQPALEMLLNTQMTLAFVASIYLVFYSPFDIFYKLIESLKLKFIFSGIQEILRIKLVLSGVQTIQKLHPESFIYPVVFGFIKSSGFMFVKYFEQVLVNGHAKPLIIPNYPTKSCLISSVLFAAHSLKLNIFNISTILTIQELYFYTISAVIIFKLMTVICDPTMDPYLPMENILKYCIVGLPIKNEEKKGSKNENKKDK